MLSRTRPGTWWKTPLWTPSSSGASPRGTASWGRCTPACCAWWRGSLAQSPRGGGRRRTSGRPSSPTAGSCGWFWQRDIVAGNIKHITPPLERWGGCSETPEQAKSSRLPMPTLAFYQRHQSLAISLRSGFPGRSFFDGAKDGQAQTDHQTGTGGAGGSGGAAHPQVAKSRSKEPSESGCQKIVRIAAAVCQRAAGVAFRRSAALALRRDGDAHGPERPQAILPAVPVGSSGFGGGFHALGRYFSRRWRGHSRRPSNGIRRILRRTPSASPVL